jgi:hypothetical protein
VGKGSINGYRASQEEKCIASNPFWTYLWMVCQLTDCIDALKVIYGDLHEFMFLFHHSCWHDKMSINIVENMIKNGGRNK